MAISLPNHSRLATLFDAEVVGVYPMSLTELGQVEFIGEAANRSTVSHALVVIKDNKTGKPRRVWQFRHDISGKDERFHEFHEASQIRNHADQSCAIDDVHRRRKGGRFWKACSDLFARLL